MPLCYNLAHSYNNFAENQNFGTMKRSMLINVNNRPDACPQCGGNIVDIIYGEPNQELYEQSLRNEVILGGCCVVVDETGNMTNPEWGCVKCGRQFKLVK